jgi:hypothetical protein
LISSSANASSSGRHLERYSGLEIYDQLELGRSLDGEIRGLAPFRMRSTKKARRVKRVGIGNRLGVLD